MKIIIKIFYILNILIPISFIFAKFLDVKQFTTTNPNGYTLTIFIFLFLIYYTYKYLSIKKSDIQMQKYIIKSTLITLFISEVIITNLVFDVMIAQINQPIYMIANQYLLSIFIYSLFFMFYLLKDYIKIKCTAPSLY